MSAITKADLDQVFAALEAADVALGELIPRTEDPSLARAGLVGIHCGIGDLHARLRDWRAYL